jgi:drug/metabolite transporter (DMT)-like permease
MDAALLDCVIISVNPKLQKSTLSVAAPFAYLQIVFAVIIGLVFFGHWPDNMTLLGTALIAAGGITSAWLNSKSPAKAQLPTTTL